MRARGDGLQVLIARSEEGNRELARKLTGIGVRAMTLNTLSFQEPEDWSSVDFQLRNLDSVDWIVFTSATGVKFFAKRLKELGVGLPEGGRPRVAAVGEKTAEKPLALARELYLFNWENYLKPAILEAFQKEFGVRVIENHFSSNEEMLAKVLTGQSGIRTRHFAVHRLEDAFELTPDALHGRFTTHAPALATEAAERALADAGRPASRPGIAFKNPEQSPAGKTLLHVAPPSEAERKAFLETYGPIFAAASAC